MLISFLMILSLIESSREGSFLTLSKKLLMVVCALLSKIEIERMVLAKCNAKNLDAS